MKIVYVAGPYRGTSKYFIINRFQIIKNILKARKIAYKLWSNKITAICPHTNTIWMQGNNDLEAFILEGDLEVLNRCDYILMCNNWKNSSGSIKEQEYAITHNIPIFYEKDIKTLINICKIDNIKSKGEIMMNDLTLDKYQSQAKTTALYLKGIKERYSDLPNDILTILGLSYVGLGLGESGEVQNKIKKLIRDTKGEVTDEFKSNIIGELGDILWYIANMCEELNISMGDVAQANLNKLFSRQERGVLQGSGDNR